MVNDQFALQANDSKSQIFEQLLFLRQIGAAMSERVILSGT